MSEGPTKRLARRAAPLTFGIFGSIQRPDELQRAERRCRFRPYAAGQAPTHEPFGYFDWQLLAPPVGSRVTIMGFSKIDLRQDLDDFEIHMDFAVEHAEVTRVFRLHRDRGMLNFPCFELDKRLDHGLSGGPVFFEDRLAGLVTSSTNFDERGYCATLWPIALMEYDSELGMTTSFGNLFTRGIIRAVDWYALKSHISLRRDEMDQRYAYIDQIPGAGDDIEP